MGIANELAANWKMLALVVAAVTAFQWTVRLFKMLDSMKDVLEDIRRDAADNGARIEKALNDLSEQLKHIKYPIDDIKDQAEELTRLLDNTSGVGNLLPRKNREL